MRYLWDVCNEDKCLHQEPGQKPGQAFRVFGQAYQKTPGRPGKAWQAWPQPRFLGNLGHQSLAYLALLLPRPTFLGNPGQKSPAYNPGLKDSSHAWPGFFEFPGQKFIPFSDCNMKPQNLWPFVVPWRTLFTLQLLFFTKNDTLSVFRNFLTPGNGCFQSPLFPDHVTIYVFCFSFSVFGPGQLLPGQARLGLWPRHSGFFFIPWPTWPKPGHKPGSPQLSDARVSKPLLDPK